MSNTVLLCPPVFFDVTYSINPWMQGEEVDRSIAMDQWFKLKYGIEEWGVEVKLIGQQPKLPDMVFTANAGTVRGKKVVLSNFKHPERQPETDVYEKWFMTAGYETHRLPKKINFEGCGDTVIAGDKMFAGYGVRSDLGGIRRAAKILDLELIPLKLEHPNFYHLDTCFCLLGPHTAMYYPGAFTPSATRKLKKHIPELIPLDVTDAAMFACNSVVHENKILMPSGPQNIVKELDIRGYEITQINTSEFLKSGGSLQCMTLWI
jgi:N-dimethylarginine dimethylaminohydrolase